MITGFFIVVGNFFLTFLNVVLPSSSSLPSALSDALEYVGTALNSVSYLLPVTALFASLAIVIGYEASIWLYHGILWTWKKIPFIGK